VRFANDDRGFPGPYGTNPIGAYQGIDTISRGTDDRWLGSVASMLPLGGRARMQAQVAYGSVDGTYVDPYGTSENTSRRMTARWQADASVAAALDVSAGVQFDREQAESTFITGSAFQQVPVKRRVIGYFGEGRWHSSDRLFVSAGLRVDDIQRESLESDPNAYSPRPAFSADSVVSTNPKIAGAWFVRPASGTFTRLRAAAGTGIRPPDAFEIAFTDNPSLKPERSRSLEFGLDQAVAGAHGLVEATAFFNNYDDLIVAVGSFEGISRYRTDNIANARARGVELAATGRSRVGGAHGADIDVRVAYTFLDTEVLAVDGSAQAQPPFTPGDPLLRRPRHQFSADVLVSDGRLSAFVHGGGRSRVLDVEPSTGTYGGLFFAEGYNVWNAGASWRIVRGFDLFARVENLFDTEYEEALGYPAPRRGAMVGLRVAASR
jgi:outer membrane receptor protein involved in Fe transport